MLTSAPDGLSGFNLTVSINSGAAVELTNGSVPDSFDLANVTVADGNTRVTLKGADLENATTPGATNVTLATVELRGARVGNATVSVDVSKMDDDDGDRLNRSVREGTVEVATPRPLASDLPTPTDPDGDGDFEDINGNGELDFDDVVELFQNLENAQRPFQDFNGNGRGDFVDVVELFGEVGF